MSMESDKKGADVNFIEHDVDAGSDIVTVATQGEVSVPKKKKCRWKGWIIALSIVLAVVLTIVIILSINNYSPNKNYYGNGTVWSLDDNFDDYYENMPTLVFDENRELKIMQIADPQLKVGSFTSDKNTFDLLDKAIDNLKPDIAVVTGDLTLSIFARSAVKYFADFMESKKVYWAFTYGNHDSELSLSKYRHAQLLSKYEYCLFDGGPSNIKGESNYFVKVVNGTGKLLYALSLIDSNMYPETKDDLFEMKYDEIQQSQVDWYEWNIAGLKTKNANVQSAMFMHIPLKQMVSVYNNQQNPTYVGNITGSVCEMPWDDNGVQAPGIYYQGGTGGQAMYNAIVANGSTKGVFFGHDHINTLRGITDDGILLAYGRNCGYHTYPFFEKQGQSKLLEGIFESLFGYTGASMYLDQWKDEYGHFIGKGVSMIEINVDVESAGYGAIWMYDVGHDKLSSGDIEYKFSIRNPEPIAVPNE